MLIKRLLIIIVLLIFVIYIYISFYSKKHSKKLKEEINISTQEVSSIKSQKTPGYEDFLLQYKNDYRLKPDHRFLSAIIYIDQFFTSKDIGKAETAFMDGKWIIKYGDYEIGNIPELPDFSDFVVLLRQYARKMIEKYPLEITVAGSYENREKVRQGIDELLIPYITQALIEINTIWESGAKNAQLLKDGTRSYVFFAIQSLDTVQMADALIARAIAFLVIAQEFTGDAMLEEEILLADYMGYTTHASKKALMLPEDNSIRLYAIRSYNALKTKAEKSNADALTRYLRLKHLVELRSVDEWAAWIENYYRDKNYSLSLLKSIVDIDVFILNKYFVGILSEILLFNMAIDVNSFGPLDRMQLIVSRVAVQLFSNRKFITKYVRRLLGLDKVSQIRKFNTYVKLLEEKYKGPFLDSASIKLYYQSYFFSVLYMQGLFYLDSLSSVEMVQEFDYQIGGEVDPVASEFQSWYKNLTISKSGKADINKLLFNITGMKYFGTPLLERTFEELKEHYSYADPKLMPTIKQIIRKMDSRVTDRIFLANMAYSSFLDLPLLDKIESSAISMDIYMTKYERIWMAYFSRNIEQLKQFASDEYLEPKYRSDAVKRLEKCDVLIDEVISLYQNIVNRYPNDWVANYDFVRCLVKNKKFSEARSAALTWLERKIPTAGLEVIKMMNQVGWAYYDEGLYKEGLDYIYPEIEGQVADTMVLAAKLMTKLFRHEEAKKLLNFAMERYPDSQYIFISYVGFLWETMSYDEAASLIKNRRYPLSAEAWRYTIGEEFIEMFKNNDSEAIKAFTALINIGLNHWDLINIPMQVNVRGNSTLAFELNTKLQASGLGYIQMQLDSYKYLKQSKGKEEAFKWVKDKISQQMLNPASMIMFNNDEYDLLWDLIANPEQGSYPDFVWLMRAAGWLKEGRKNDNYKNTLIAYFQKNNTTYYQKLGRYLLDLSAGDELIDYMKKDPKQRCELSYYFGLKAQINGNYEEASDWYHISIETGLINMGEYRWSFNQLYKWYCDAKRLET